MTGSIKHLPPLAQSLDSLYDYCSIPHSREDEYELPAAVRKGSVKAALVYLEYLQGISDGRPATSF